MPDAHCAAALEILVLTDRHGVCPLLAVRFLDLIKPFTPLLPEVAAPETKIPFNQKLMWTGVCFLCFPDTARVSSSMLTSFVFRVFYS